MSIAERERPVHRPNRGDRDYRRLRTVAPLVVDDACDVRIRGRCCADGVRVALLEWLPLTCDDLLRYEGRLSVRPRIVSRGTRPPADDLVDGRRGRCSPSDPRSRQHNAGATRRARRVRLHAAAGRAPETSALHRGALRPAALARRVAGGERHPRGGVRDRRVRRRRVRGGRRGTARPLRRERLREGETEGAAPTMT